MHFKWFAYLFSVCFYRGYRAFRLFRSSKTNPPTSTTETASIMRILSSTVFCASYSLSHHVWGASHMCALLQVLSYCELDHMILPLGVMLLVFLPNFFLLEPVATTSKFYMQQLPHPLLAHTISIYWFCHNTIKPSVWAVLLLLLWVDSIRCFEMCVCGELNRKRALKWHCYRFGKNWFNQRSFNKLL